MAIQCHNISPPVGVLPGSPRHINQASRSYTDGLDKGPKVGLLGVTPSSTARVVAGAPPLSTVYLHMNTIWMAGRWVGDSNASTPLSPVGHCDALEGYYTGNVTTDGRPIVPAQLSWGALELCV